MAGRSPGNDPKIAADMKMYRNYGSEKRYYNKVVGANSRLDEIQAGLLRVRLSHMEELTQEKIEIAARYDRELSNAAFTLPQKRPHANHIYHQYVIRTEHREALIDYLNKKEIGTIIHYPIPPASVRSVSEPRLSQRRSADCRSLCG